MNAKVNFLVALIGLALVVGSGYLHGALGVIVLGLGVVGIAAGMVMQFLMVIVSHPPQGPKDGAD